jgi:hypothetical protein
MHLWRREAVNAPCYSGKLLRALKSTETSLRRKVVRGHLKKRLRIAWHVRTSRGAGYKRRGGYHHLAQDDRIGAIYGEGSKIATPPWTRSKQTTNSGLLVLASNTLYIGVDEHYPRRLSKRKKNCRSVSLWVITMARLRRTCPLIVPLRLSP